MPGFHDLLDRLRKKRDSKPIPPEDLEKYKSFVRDKLLKALTTQSESIVDALESFGLTEAQANELIAKVLAELTKEVVPPTPA